MAMYELAYLIPVNVLILWMAFRKHKRYPAGLLAVVAGLLYAPVRFVLEFWRLNQSDQRYVGLTFAQWSSILAFGAAGYIAMQVWKKGKPHPLEDELGGRVGGRIASLVALAKADAAAAKTDDADAAGDDAAGDDAAPAKSGSKSGKKNKR